MSLKPAGLLPLLLLLAGFTAFGQEQFDSIYRNGNSYGLSDFINYKANFIRQKLYEDAVEIDEDYFIVKQNGRYGVYNETKRMLYAEAKYDTITPTGNYLLNGRWGNLLYVEKISDLILEHPRGIVFIRDGKYGLKKISGETILKAEYNEILPRQYGLFFIKKNGRWGFVNADRDNSLVKPKHDFLVQYTDFDTQYPTVFAYDNKVKTPYSIYGETIRKKQKPAKQKREVKRYTEFTNGYWFGNWKPETVFFTNGKKNGVKDASGKIIIPAKYDMIHPMMDGNYLVSKDTLYGMLGSKGQTIIPLLYGAIEPVKGDALKDNLFYVYRQNTASVFDASGNQLYPFDMLYSEGAMPMDEDYKKVCFQVVENKILEKGKEIDEYGEPQFSHDIYSKALLLYENGKITKVLGNCTEIKYTDYSEDYIVAYTQYGSTLYGFYSQKTGKKTDALYKEYMVIGNGRIMAKKGGHYDTLLDSTMIARPLSEHVIAYRNGYYLVNDNGMMRIMDESNNVSTFAYQKIEYLVDFKNFRNISPELVAIYSKVFKYYDASGKCGLIDADGKVLFTSGVYDDITIALRASDEPHPSPEKAKIMNQYLNRIMVAKRYTDKNNAETDLYFEGEKIASFNTYKYWQLKYNDITANNQLILRQPGIKLYNLATQTIDLETNTANFSEDADGGFTIVYGYTKHRIEKYSTGGKLLSVDSIPTDKLYHYERSKAQYIHNQNGKYGLVNVKGETLSPFTNDTLSTYDYNYYIAKRGVKMGVITSENTTLPFEYENITYHPYEWKNNEEGVYILKKNGKYGVADTNATLLLPPGYDTAFAKGEFIIAGKGTAFSAYDRSGKLLFTLESSTLEPFTTELLYFTKNGKQGIITKNGTILMDPIYKNLTLITSGRYLADAGSEKYLVNQNGLKMVETPLQSANCIYSDYEPFDITEEFLVLQDTNGKYALYSLKMKQLLPFDYDNIDQVENFKYAIVEKNRLMGVVTVDNKTVIPLIYKYIRFQEDYGCFEAETEKARYLISPDGIILSEELDD